MNMLVLERVFGDEHLSKIKMHFESLCVSVYDQSLKLRSESMAKKLEDIITTFEEVVTTRKMTITQSRHQIYLFQKEERENIDKIL